MLMQSTLRSNLFQILEIWTLQLKKCRNSMIFGMILQVGENLVNMINLMRWMAATFTVKKSDMSPKIFKERRESSSCKKEKESGS